MTPEERTAHMRALGSRGGKSTVARHGTEHMQAIGKRGFAVAVELGWGQQLAGKLGPTYQAKFGKPIVLSPQSQEKARIRTQAREIYAGQVCDVPGCESIGQVHHIHGLGGSDPNEPANIAIRCAHHHRATHRDQRRAHLRQWKEVAS